MVAWTRVVAEDMGRGPSTMSAFQKCHQQDLKAEKDQQRGKIPGAQSVVRGRVQGPV